MISTSLRRCVQACRIKRSSSTAAQRWESGSWTGRALTTQTGAQGTDPQACGLVQRTRQASIRNTWAQCAQPAFPRGESVKVFKIQRQKKFTTEAQRAQRFQSIENLFFFLRVLCASVVQKGCFSLLLPDYKNTFTVWAHGNQANRRDAECAEKTKGCHGLVVSLSGYADYPSICATLVFSKLCASAVNTPR